MDFGVQRHGNGKTQDLFLGGVGTLLTWGDMVGSKPGKVGRSLPVRCAVYPLRRGKLVNIFHQRSKTMKTVFYADLSDSTAWAKESKDRLF